MGHIRTVGHSSPARAAQLASCLVEKHKSYVFPLYTVTERRYGHFSAALVNHYVDFCFDLESHSNFTCGRRRRRQIQRKDGERTSSNGMDVPGENTAYVEERHAVTDPTLFEVTAHRRNREKCSSLPFLVAIIFLELKHKRVEVSLLTLLPRGFFLIGACVLSCQSGSKPPALFAVGYPLQARYSSSNRLKVFSPE